MKTQITLIIAIYLLFINNVYAESTGASSCKLALNSGDTKTALVQAKQAISSNKNDKDALVCQGRALAMSDDLNGALAVFKLADAQSVDAFDKTVTAMLIGNTHKALKQYEQAIASYDTATENAKVAKVVAYERASYNAKGNVYALNQQSDLAITQYQLGSKLAANDNERAESYEKLAQMHQQLKQHDIALEYQLKAYVMQEKSGSLDEHANAGIALGQAYMLTKNYLSAENMLNKMIQFAQENGGAYYEAKASYTLANVKNAKGEKDAANALIEKAKEIAKNTHDTELEQEISQLSQN